MIVDGQVIPETLSDPGSILTHQDRFGSAAAPPAEDGVPAHGWMKGADLLLKTLPGDATAATRLPSASQLPSEPRGEPDRVLWIPVDCADATPVGPVYPVVAKEAGDLLRVRSRASVRCLEGLTVAVDDRRYEVLAVLDSMDVSARHHLERRLRKGLSVPRQSHQTRPVEQPDGAGDGKGLPPAAASILQSIEKAAPGTYHVAALERRGAGPLLDLLLERELIIVLHSGQVVSLAAYQEVGATLPAAGTEVNSRDAAGRWGTSFGLARAILDRLAADGVVDRVAPGNYKVM